MKAQIDPAVYQAGHQSAILVDRSDLGMLRIQGESRLDLIHRMSTQNVRGLQPGEGAATILTTDVGRMVDRLILYAAPDTVYALTGENNSDVIARYLMRFVFFNDDFHIQDISKQTAIFAVYGPRARHILGEEVGFPEVDIPLHHWREAEVGGVTAYLHRTDPINGDGYFVMCEMANRDALAGALRGAGLVEADDAAFDLLRIEAGQPRFGHEITGEYIPLEAGLWNDVSFNKGCYTGQEIIARMESRGKIAKQLVRLTVDTTMAEGQEIQTGTKTVGTITSVAHADHRMIGIGYIKSAVLAEPAPLSVAGQQLQILSSAGSGETEIASLQEN
ncbi:MAG: YgfZ/GcvT domain-containing protein [Candidatus Promineifilaceae bacterium]